MFAMMGPIMFILFMVLIIWSVVWKGIGLWKAAGNKHLAWFICILVFNTAGILPIIYIVFFSKKKVAKPVKKKAAKKPKKVTKKKSKKRKK